MKIEVKSAKAKDTAKLHELFVQKEELNKLKTGLKTDKDFRQTERTK